MARKPVINLVFLGNVDHGKSTLIGRLLYDLGRIGDSTIAKLRSLASQVKDESYYLAYIIDYQLEERKRGHTIEVAFWEPIETGKNFIKIIDVPGMSDWINNTITGTAQADAAVVVVDAHDVMARGLGRLVGLREHLILAFIFGVGQLIVAINKMDLVDYDKGVYEHVREGLAKLVRGVGYRDVETMPFVPISALRGDNVVRRSENMPWYSGPTLYEALEELREPPRPVDKPLRLPIHRHFHRGNIAVGVVETGVISKGDMVVVVPAGAVGKVVSMEAWGKRIEKAYPGDDIGVKMKGVARYHIKRGFVIAHPETAPRAVRSFVGRIKVLSSRGIWPGFCPVVHCHQARVACRVKEILRKVDPRSGKTLEEGPSFLAEGEIGDVLLEPLVPKQKGLVIERYREFPSLGRFALRAGMGGGRRGSITIAAGICLDIEPYE